MTYLQSQGQAVGARWDGWGEVAQGAQPRKHLPQPSRTQDALQLVHALMVHAAWPQLDHGLYSVACTLRHISMSHGAFQSVLWDLLE